MIPVPAHVALELLDGEFGTRRALALNHAARLGLEGFWADRRTHPSCLVLWIPAEDGSRSLFAAGKPDPAISWLADQPGRFRLMAPSGWAQPLSKRVVGLEPSRTVVRFRPDTAPLPAPALKATRVRPSSSKRFETVVPAWAWRSWGTPRACLEQGAAYALFQNSKIAACAWIVEEDDLIAGVGVFTAERFRKLGLGRAVTATLLGHLSKRRHRCPLWATTSGNEASIALAASLGFSLPCDELVVSWGGEDLF